MIDLNISLVSIDPDTKMYGWAYFYNRMLMACGPCPVDSIPTILQRNAAHWVCEVPERRGKLSNIKVQDLLDLSLAAGRIVGRNACDFVKPSRWKGQISKKQHHACMFAALDRQEHFALEDGVKLCTKDSILDVNDAVCLGLWRLGRLR